MAKLFDNMEDMSAKKRNVLKTVFLLLALVAVVFGSLVYYRTEESALEEAEKNAVVGVHIKGAVKNGGYYEVPYGTRIKDLGDVAGGFEENVDLEGVNLAAYANDGEEIYFPYKGSEESGAKNLNEITYEELIEIDGIGETTANKIIAYRDANGGFKSVYELKDVLGDSKYETLREAFYVQ